MARFRDLKHRLAAALESPDWEAGLRDVLALEPGQAVGPLFSFFLRPGLVWPAVTALGLVADRMFHAGPSGPEDARVVMRRLMWHLNEESGNLGWGAAEAMAEIMAVNATLAGEFHRILASYISDGEVDGNYLDHPPLRRGAFWGVGRLAQVRPELVRPAVPSLLAGLHNDEDPPSRGLAAWALGLLRAPEAASPLRALLDDPTPVELFRNRALEHTSVASLAREALERIISNEYHRGTPSHTLPGG